LNTFFFHSIYFSQLNKLSLNWVVQSIGPRHYFGKGKKWHDPKVERVALNYEYAKKIYEEDGRKIYNATVGGKLELFERADYGQLFV